MAVVSQAPRSPSRTRLIPARGQICGYMSYPRSWAVTDVPVRHGPSFPPTNTFTLGISETPAPAVTTDTQDLLRSHVVLQVNARLSAGKSAMYTTSTLSFISVSIDRPNHSLPLLRLYYLRRINERARSSNHIISSCISALTNLLIGLVRPLRQLIGWMVVAGSRTSLFSSITLRKVYIDTRELVRFGAYSF